MVSQQCERSVISVVFMELKTLFEQLQDRKLAIPRVHTLVKTHMQRRESLHMNHGSQSEETQQAISDMYKNTKLAVIMKIAVNPLKPMFILIIFKNSIISKRTSPLQRSFG
jgi:hypothetical protein